MISSLPCPTELSSSAVFALTEEPRTIGNIKPTASLAPWQSGHVESFHNRLRDECLNQEDFLSVLEAQVVIEEWRLLYNKVHPHSKLGFQSPEQFSMNHQRLEPNIQSGPEMVS